MAKKTDELLTKEVTKEEVRVLKNPFCNVPVREYKKIAPPPYLEYVGVDVDKETMTTTPRFEKVDLNEKVKSGLPFSGFEGMKNALKTGRAIPSDFADDGRHGVDLTNLPPDVHNAKKLADQKSLEIADLAKAVGVPEGKAVSGDVLEDYLKRAVEKAWNELQAKNKEVNTNE